MLTQGGDKKVLRKYMKLYKMRVAVCNASNPSPGLSRVNSSGAASLVGGGGIAGSSSSSSSSSSGAAGSSSGCAGFCENVASSSNVGGRGYVSCVRSGGSDSDSRPPSPVGCSAGLSEVSSLSGGGSSPDYSSYQHKADTARASAFCRGNSGPEGCAGVSRPAEGGGAHASEESPAPGRRGMGTSTRRTLGGLAGRFAPSATSYRPAAAPPAGAPAEAPAKPKRGKKLRLEPKNVLQVAKLHMTLFRSTAAAHASGQVAGKNGR
eukprot:GHVT01066147.1.p1 GENE.GHVT01066147.1~~GHVT01066147.1.p1  ORF type:complete len:264 (+),score=69.78 GHVT01066147.1:264-1055(+)